MINCDTVLWKRRWKSTSLHHYKVVKSNQCELTFARFFFFLIGEMRNDLYITVERGEFEKGGKSVARNVEVTMHVVDSGGQILRVLLLWICPCCS